MLSYEGLIAEIRSNEELLNSWEIDFMESIDNLETESFSQSQRDKIIQIHLKVTT